MGLSTLGIAEDPHDVVLPLLVIPGRDGLIVLSLPCEFEVLITSDRKF
jgi:hypothetical protein